MRVAPLLSKVTKKLKILDFDIENRPLTYLGGDYTTADVTAIACSWVGMDTVCCWLLGVHSYEEMFEGFMTFYNEADIVTGHYIRKHDLPILNGAMLEFGLPTMGAKLTSDTKIDLIKRSDISASQESLAALLGLPEPKESMSQTDWRMANRLSPEGIERTRTRVMADVIQHKALRSAMLERNLLGKPRMWRP
jgi:hypothetical protein